MGGKRWTNEEDNRLRESFARGLTISACVSSFPGRTYDGLLCRAIRLGIDHAEYATWTADEDAILREIWATPRYLKQDMHRLPNRSYEAAKVRAARLGLGRKARGEIGTRSFVVVAVRMALSNGVQMSMRELAEKTGISVKSIQPAIDAHHGKEFYVASWEYSDPNHPVMKWAIGTGPDAPKPRAKTSSEYNHAYRQRQRIAKGDINPFASLAGMVAIPQGQPGRIVHKCWDDHDMECAA